MIVQENASDEKFMHRAFELAQLGLGSARPNPIVGCVIVHDGKIIGEGWHRNYGEAHAEVNAVNAVHPKDIDLLKASTVYVTLEPCSHFGKTPPCADLLIRHNVKRVVIANIDTNPLVGGKGIDKLRAAGIEVKTNVLAGKGRLINKRFFTFIEKKRPYVILKWAQTADGFIARENFDSKWISHAMSRQLVHKWRAEEHAIMVGTSTAQHDNPQLTVRDWSGQNPIRIVIDKKLALNRSLYLFDQRVPTLCYNLEKTESLTNLEFIKLSTNQFEQQLLNDLYQRKIQSLIIEGGARTLQSFIDLKLWDEARRFTSQENFGTGIPAPQIEGKLVSRDAVTGDTLEILFPATEPNDNPIRF